MGWSFMAHCGVSAGARPGRSQLHVSCFGALATSGSGTQFFMHQGRRYGHILDPRSGWPSEGVLTVSVLAPTAAEADALATAFYVMGPQAANGYCQQHREVSAVMLCPGPREGSFETHLFGLDQHEWSVQDEG